jgi:hypothetical protein
MGITSARRERNCDDDGANLHLSGLIGICHYNFQRLEICHWKSPNWIYAIAVQPGVEMEWQISNIAPNCNN